MRAAPHLQLVPEFAERGPDDPVALAGSDVDLWAFRLDPDEASVDALWRVLDPSERARAERYRFPEHHRRFTVGRGMLRLLLSRYLGVPKEEIRLSFAPRGKPHLAAPLDASGLCFNLSNSADLAVVAVARGVRLGVDVEMLRPLSSATALATRFFSRREQLELAAVDPAAHIVAFFQGWTRKEAFLKALGDGLAMPLGSFTVTLSPGAAPQLTHVERADVAAGGWTLRTFTPAIATVGALAIEGRAWRIRSWAADAAVWTRSLTD